METHPEGERASMGSEKKPADEPREIPEDATIIRQVPWAWFYSSVPWIGALVVLLYVGFIEEFSSILVLAVILVPRFISWRRTAYILTEDTLIYQRGGVFGAQSFDIPIASLKDVRARFGLFGRALGYEAVDVMLENNAVAALTYVPALAELGGRIQEMIDEFGHASEDEDTGPAADSREGPASGDASGPPG